MKPCNLNHKLTVETFLGTMRKDNLDMTFTGHTEGKSVRRKQRVTFLVITGKMGGRTGSGRDSE